MYITSFTSPARPDFTRLCCQRLDHPPPLVGRVPFDMDRNARVDKPMEQTVTEEPTGTASGGSKSPVVPKAFTIPTTPVSVQDGDESGFKTPGRRRRKGKVPAEQSADAPPPKPLPKGVSFPSPTTLFKRPTGDNPNAVHLWNAGGKRSNKRAPKEHEPKVVVVDQTPIYVQNLTAVQAEACGVVGWDAVLVDTAVMLPEAAETRIVAFWADWRRKLRKSKNAAAAERRQTAANAAKPPLDSTPSAGEKRKGATPSSSEPVGKSSKTNYADAANRGAKRANAKKDHEEILWVHSTEEEKGPVSESIFFFVISRINAIKIKAINNDDESHNWSPAIRGQPIYDHVNQRGKIVCTNKQTVDFWVKYIEMISPSISKVQLKAWTSKEYDDKNSIYSCLIPNQTCIGIPSKDIIAACLRMYTIRNSEGIVRCYTSYTKESGQRICIIEVTEKLATLIENQSRVLSGPYGHMTFKRRSGDPGETVEEETLVDDDAPMVPVLPAPVPELGRSPVPPAKVLNIARTRAVSEAGTGGSSIPDSTGDSVLASSPERSSKNTKTRAPSLADSVDRSVGSKLKKLGLTQQSGKSLEDYPPFPSQKSKD